MGHTKQEKTRERMKDTPAEECVWETQNRRMWENSGLGQNTCGLKILIHFSPRKINK